MEIVRRGHWLYDATIKQPVDIVGLDFDFWYRIGEADDALEPGDAPEALGPDGRLYYVRFRNAGSTATPTWVDSGGHATIEAAMESAEARVPSSIVWSSPA